MRAEKHRQPTRSPARWLTKKKRVVGGVATTAAVVAAFVGAGAAATAAETDNAEAEGRFLTFGGSLGDTVNFLAELAPAYSANPSGDPENSRSLDLELLSALDIPLGDGLQLFGENPILGLGALGQYSRTDAGSAYASSGLLGEEGAIAPAAGNDPSENAYLDLTPILAQAGLDILLDNARLELGAISASAEIGADGEPEGVYQIAGGTLLLTSPVVADLSGSLVGVLDQISDPINAIAGDGGLIDDTVDPLLDGLTSTLNAVLLGVGSIDDLGVTATVDVDLEAAVQSVLSEPITSDDSVITIDFSTGEVSVDLARLVADTQGGDYDGTLNGLDPNTELLDPDLVQAALDGAIGSVFDQIPALLVNAVTDALHAVDVNIAITGEINSLLGNIGMVDVQLAGTLGDFIGAEGSSEPTVDTSGTSLIGLPVGQLLEPVLQTVTNTILPALVTPLSNAITDEGTLDTIFRPVVEAANQVLQPLFGIVTNNLLSLTANVQETGGTFTHEDAANTEGTFTERALQLSLLPQSPILELSLGSATVRAGDAVVYETSIDVTPGSVEQGESTTITGSGFEPGESVSVTLDGQEIGPVTADADGNIELPYTTEADDATGTFDVIATGDVSQTPAEGSLEITEATADPDTDTDADSAADGEDADENANASSSASASANADDESNASAQAAAQAAAQADASTSASAAADADATAAAQSAANEDASSDASSDVSSDTNASSQAAAQAAAQADASSTANADASSAADADAGAASAAAANADSSSDASAAAAANADADVDGDADPEGDPEGDSTSEGDPDTGADGASADENANASSSAAASANADDDSNASAQAAAQAAAQADASTSASAAADADATAAAQSAANEDASSDASSDVSSDTNASSQAAAQAAAQADASSTANADASSAADADAGAASAAAANADSSSDASAAAAANADGDADGADADADPEADSSSDGSDTTGDVNVDADSAADGDDADENANASSSASASANADDDSNASAEAAAQAAAQADASTSASAAADADASAAAEAAANEDASSDASSDVSSEANASSQAAAQATAQADASSTANADSSSAADADAGAASAAAANADSSSDASSASAANADGDADGAEASASADSDADGSDASANADGDADGAQISMDLENDRLQVGEEQVAYGYGFEPGETVTATQFSDPYAIGEQVADDSGEVTFTWNVPAGTDDGNHLVELAGETSGSVEQSFEVYSGGDLSPTGGDLALTLGGIAAAMMLAGAGVWFAVRRRADA